MSNLFLILCSSVVNEIFWQPQCWMRISHVNTIQQQPGEETVCPTELEIKDLHGLARSRELNRLRLLYFKVVLSFSLEEGNMCQQQQQSLMPLQIWQYNIVSSVPAQISFNTRVRHANGLPSLILSVSVPVNHMQLGQIELSAERKQRYLLLTLI